MILVLLEKKISRPLESCIVQCFTEPKVSEKKKIAEKIKEKEKLQKKKQEELKKRVSPYFFQVSKFRGQLWVGFLGGGLVVGFFFFLHSSTRPVNILTSLIKQTRLVLNASGGC